MGANSAEIAKLMGLDMMKSQSEGGQKLKCANVKEAEQTNKLLNRSGLKMGEPQN